MSQKMTTSFQPRHLMNLIYGKLPKQVSSLRRTDRVKWNQTCNPKENYDFKGIDSPLYHSNPIRLSFIFKTHINIFVKKPKKRMKAKWKKNERNAKFGDILPDFFLKRWKFQNRLCSLFIINSYTNINFNFKLVIMINNHTEAVINESSGWRCLFICLDKYQTV